MNGNQREFIEAYKALCLKHKIYISACGCCDSPFPIEEADWHGGSESFEKRVNQSADHLASQFTPEK